jgi:hypothetical protein
MTCVVRKTLAEIGEIEPVKYTITSFGKLVFDESSWLLNFIKVEHARFLLKDNMNKNALMTMYKIHQNRNYNLRVSDVVSDEINAINETINKFNEELPTWLLVISRSNKSLNVSITDIPLMSNDNRSINETLKAINQINLRSICTTCDPIDKLQSYPLLHIEHIDDVKLLDITIDDITRAYQTDLKNAESLMHLENYLADTAHKIHLAHACLRKYIKQLEAK